MIKYRYTENDFINVVSSSSSIRECLLKLKIVPAGGNYDTFRKLIQKYNINVSHFKGQAHNKGKKFQNIYPIEAYTSGKRVMKSSSFKHRLVKEGLLKWKCANCRKTKWMGKTMPLELSHKDGNKLNNSLENLELLCPNCHSFTFDWRKAKTKYLVPRNCKKCGVSIPSRRRLCDTCHKRSQYKNLL